MMSMFYGLVIFCLWIALVYLLVSILIILFLRKIKIGWLKGALITFYFCSTVFSSVTYGVAVYSFYAGSSSEDLRRSSVDTAEYVRILQLLEKSNAKEIAPDHYGWVTHNLENQIDFLLPIANDYLTNKNSMRWKMTRSSGLGDMEEICFPRDLPGVVAYRKTHPLQGYYYHGRYDSVLLKYSEPNPISKSCSPNFQPNK